MERKKYFVADTTVNITSTAEQLAQIAIQTHDLAKIYLTEQPRVAMLSFSNFIALNILNRKEFVKQQAL